MSFTRIASALLLLATLSSATNAQAQIDDYERQGWERIWQDEFDAPTIDTSVWNVLNRRDSFNQEKQYYLDSQVAVVDGKARLTATDEPFDGKDYRSGLIRTHQEWSYGRFEIRADLPTSQGMWPAIWLLPRTVNWPTGGEIDIMENRGSQPNLTSSAYHWQTNPNTPCCNEHTFVYDEYTATDAEGAPVNFHEGFHDYAVEWEPKEIRFYVDGNRHFTVTDQDATLFGTQKSLIINLAVGGFFGGDPDGTTVFPQHLDIEYARLWQRENGFFGIVNGGFDENGGSLNSWNTFGNDGTNLSVAGGGSYTGESALRLAAGAGGSSFAGAYQGVEINGGETLRARVESLVPSGEGFSAGTVVSLKVEFYTQFGGQFESASYLGQEVLDIADLTTPTGEWRHNEFLVDAPASAVEARLTAILAEGGATAGAVLLDGLSLVAVDGLAGDFNFDGVVDAADYTVWRDTLDSTNNFAADANRDGTVNAADHAIWASNFGNTSASSAAVPEANSIALALFALLGLLKSRR